MVLIIQLATALAVVGAIACLAVRRNRERDRNAPVRDAIEARVSYRASLDGASHLGTGGFGGTRGMWIALQGPKRLTVGADAFMVSAPQALAEYVFTAAETTIALSQAPSRVVNRDWIVITRHDGDRPLRLAITRGNLPEVWHALALTGVTLAPPVSEFEQAGRFLPALGRVRGWRRVALGLGFMVAFFLIPPLVIFIGHHLH